MSQMWKMHFSRKTKFLRRIFEGPNKAKGPPGLALRKSKSTSRFPRPDRCCAPSPPLRACRRPPRGDVSSTLEEASAEGRRRWRASRTACRCCGLLPSCGRGRLFPLTRAASSAASTRRSACATAAPKRIPRHTPFSPSRPPLRPHRALPASS